MFVKDLIANLPENEKKIILGLRNCILETAPMLREKLSYGVPYYYRKSRVCFIWPASVPNGGLTEGVALGFCKGYLMSNEEGLLQSNGRKEVIAVHYVSISQINWPQVRQWIQEALIVDETS
ncbi:DUF1801 domain-containing protein [Rhodocytophaga aerolata]|uniref:DUF1801 domain-containing protein n=1 Tax=Rhodocytophaga aerolata TaxID=455078 RepID=A0ABT8R1Y3_9BACT|nr:DUF1801 domain-containing protein [Rhodocytophaga aerolata]MDO1445258.1 DUF1801 domain-containing protein [Rhodocytophaga aerolata]